MITPIRNMTINQIMERKDDLLVSVDDIKEIATNARKKAIENLVEEIKAHAFYHNFYGVSKFVAFTEEVDELAEQLKSKTKL